MPRSGHGCDSLDRGRLCEGISHDNVPTPRLARAAGNPMARKRRSAESPEAWVRICVLGTYSLTGRGPKIGTQHIAETLARQGHDVLYLTAQASWLALLFPQHRARYLSTFGALRINERLVQATPVKLFPMRTLKQLEGTPLHGAVVWLNAAVERTRGRVLEKEEFDLCIFSAANSMTLLRRVRAPCYIYRVNDLLSGFSGVPRSLLEFERYVLENYPIAEVCPVNEQLAAHFRAGYPNRKVRVIPNGVDLALFQAAEPDPVLRMTRSTNVIYVGSFDLWTDVDLILATAARLPDHSFHLFGSGNKTAPAALPPNVHVYGPIPHQGIATKMKGCSVGLIPSGPQNAGRMVEKPLKYYEYLAAGLGVAATSFAGKGLEPLAVLGDSPDQLADAIREAKSVPARLAPEIREALRGLGWDGLVRQLLESVK
jgi:glycosyltransferase involved in cell wall biosynthesis